MHSKHPCDLRASLTNAAFHASALLVFLFLPQIVTAQQPKSTSRDTMWKKVDEAVQKGLPKSAIEALSPIIEAALADKAFPEAIKAIAKRVLLEGQIEGQKPEEHIARMKAEIANAPPEMLPAMQAILAQFYWSYFEQNRWRFGQRTATSATPGDDFTTWDLPRLFGEIDSHYTQAAANEAQLRAIPIGSYDVLLTKGSVPDSYRPTLFDFIAFAAIDFYSSGEQAAAKAEDAFEIEASSPALGPTMDFIAWKPIVTDVDSPKLKAINLYQRLLAIHQNDQDRSAFLDADLGRLQFAHANAVGEEKASRYKAALKSFADTHVKHELSATARHRWAVVLQGENELVEAREIATQGKNAFPQSVGGKLCHNIIVDIEAKSVNIATERIWNDPLPMLRISYRNISKVYFRAVKVDWSSRFTVDRWSPGTLNQTDREEFIRQTPLLAWSSDLPATEDFREGTHDVPAPKELQVGYYFIIAGTRPDFSDIDNSISACDVWVSNLSIVLRQSWGAGNTEGFVLNAMSGEPVANAKVRVFVRQDRNNSVKEESAVTTNANGLFTVNSNNRGIFLLASANGQELAIQNEQRSYSQPEQPTNFVHYVLFTDRSLYRPGQSIQFKGVCLLADTDKDKYATVPNRNVIVQFRDSNGKEIERLQLRSNAFGSFNGSFSAPRDRGTGSMQIVVDDGRSGSTAISVEEYKRPKFLVTLDAPKEA
ncbi:MAG TPA: MG2 domain-containing protein, partial [Pirellula sp.]|nr:MG2 domain-containing protein [Pirellula sp.]